MMQSRSDDTPVLDRQALSDLEEMTGGDPEFLAEMIETFLAEAPTQIAAIRAGWEAGDAEVVRRNAHSLKASSLTFGARTLATHCEALELAGRQQLQGDITGTLRATEVVWNLVASALRQLLGTGWRS